MDLENFLKAPWAPICTNFEGAARAEKTQFFGQNFPKAAYRRLYWTVFSNFACGAENLAEIGTKQCFERARKVI